MVRYASPPARTGLAVLLCTAALGLAGCGDSAKIPDHQTVGASPTIPAPNPSLIPTVDIAPAKGWPTGATPNASAGMTVTALARDLDHPRWLYVLPNGDVLVAESNAPPKETTTGSGIREFVMQQVMKRAGAGVPSANRITLLRDADGNGTAELRSIFLENLYSPFGMALVGNDLYVANANAVMKFPYQEGQTRIDAPGVKVADLPGGPINHHWTKGLVASPDGRMLYVSVGSNSNVAENGMEHETNRAAVLEIDPATGQSRVFASGLRNPVGLAFEPSTGQLFAVVNERDEIGSDLVPDYLTAVREGAFYGWPYSYWGQHVDTRVEPPRPDLVAKAVVPDYALGNHVAPLGLAFATGTALPEQFRSGAFVGLHGSWNRKPPSGYKVAFVPFQDGKPTGMPVDVLTGFVAENGDANGRPVGVAFDRTGALLVADDVGNAVWRVAPPAPQTSGR
ncbi:PQQ-dependent sugar dehydrogenase [Rhodoplanes roseus]|uniref:PQQ-dependent sugar dehydrogenase n=1 Tax=Rhodoplanes roseus TaxID=29409 RepID=UPI001FE0139A|nr:sorbosone dehydrogenase family protein [Rhodoplanes roseus]